MPRRGEVGEHIIIRLAAQGENYGTMVQSQTKTMAAAGMSEEQIIDVLEESLKPGGRLFEQFMNGFKNSAGETVSYITEDERHKRWAGPDRWMWISIVDENRCEDCEERHGAVKTWEEWQAAGMPGAGATRCGWRCRCILEPREFAEEIDVPLYLGKE